MPFDAELAALDAHWHANVVDPPDRLGPIPIRLEFADVVVRTDRIDGNHWPPNEIRCVPKDRESFVRLQKTAPGSAQIVARTLAVFLTADEAVMDGLDVLDMAQLPIEYRNLVRIRNAQEVGHSRVYGNVAIFTLNPDEFAAAQGLARGHPAIAAMRQFAVKYMSPGACVVLHLLVCGVFEILAFSALFIVPHMLKKTGACPAFTNANESISRDETEHMDSCADSLRCAVASASLAVRRALVNVVLGIIVEGYDTTLPLLNWVFENNAKLLGVNLTTALEWTRFCCNRFLTQLNINGDFDDAGWRLPFPDDEQCTLPYMELLAVDSCNQRPNFFEVVSLQYDKLLPPGAFAVPDDAAERHDATLAACRKMLQN
jgi:ribonucleotide reductase beta subunit family protein with ferritin-like domain